MLDDRDDVDDDFIVPIVPGMIDEGLVVGFAVILRLAEESLRSFTSFRMTPGVGGGW